jgi:hypothetical protein
VIIRQEQFDDLESQSAKDFLLRVISDWFALYERVYGAPARTSFHTAWEIGDEIVTRLNDELLPSSGDPSYELIHEALLATEKGITRNQIDSALDSFYQAMPCVEAAFVLFHASILPAIPESEAATMEPLT